MAFTTDYTLIDGISKKQDSAWERFCKFYTPLIKLHGRDCGIDADNIDDLNQDVMAAVAQNEAIAGGKIRQGGFRHYLKRIIRNKANDILRVKYRHAAEPLQDNSVTLEEAFCCPDEEFNKAEWQDYLTDITMLYLRNELNAVHYQIFELTYLHGRKPAFVAEFLNLPLQTVYSVNTRTEEKLKKFLPFLKEKLAI